MPKTRMIAADFIQFATGVGNFYAPLFGTPAADVAKDIAFKLNECLTVISDEEPDEDFIGESEELEDGRFKITYWSGSQIPEELLREGKVDLFVNDAIGKLEEGIEQGLYPENSYQRFMVDYMLDGLRQIQRRELLGDPLQNHGLANEIPAAVVSKKLPNYGFIPKIATKTIDENGEEKWTFPEGFTEDAPEGLYAFVPRSDQEKYAIYTDKELQESATKVNLYGYSRSSMDYCDSVREVVGLATMKRPRDAEQERILREQILTNIEALRQQINKARRQADPEDPVTRRIFKDDLNQVGDTLFENERGFGADLATLDMYQNYLEAGLPVAGFSEYKNMFDSAYNFRGVVSRLEETTVGTEAFVQAARDMYARLENLPPKNAEPAVLDAWRESVREAMSRYQSEFQKIDPQKLQFKDPTNEANDQVRDEFVHGALVKENRNITQHLQNIADLGKNSIEQRRSYVDSMMADMLKNMDDMAKDLKALTKKEKNLPEDLKDAIDKVIDAGDAKNERTPARFLSALQTLQTEATVAGRGNLMDWAAENKAYFGNRVREAESLGVLSDEALRTQRKVNERHGRESLEAALTMFNTKRSRFFGAGKDKKLGKESPDHETARLAAENLVTAKRELAALIDQEGSEEWKKKAEEVMGLADTAARTAKIYISKKKNSANTPAGQERLAGAALLYREAEIVRVMIKKRIAANEMYAQMAQKTAQLAETIDPNAPRIDPAAEENARRFEEVRAREARAEKEKKQFKGAKESIRQGVVVAPKRVKDTSFAEMQHKLRLDPVEPRGHGRRHDPNASEAKEARKDGPVKQ